MTMLLLALQRTIPHTEPVLGFWGQLWAYVTLGATSILTEEAAPLVGGVITSTLLTLLVIPTFYEIMDDARGWLAGKLGFRTKQRTAEFPVPGRTAPLAGD